MFILQQKILTKVLIFNNLLTFKAVKSNFMTSP